MIERGHSRFAAENQNVGFAQKRRLAQKVGRLPRKAILAAMKVSARIPPCLPAAAPFSCWLVIAASSGSYAKTGDGEAYTGRVLEIVDGNTLKLVDQFQQQHNIRLAGIDAPETKQAFGTKAREAGFSPKYTAKR